MLWVSWYFHLYLPSKLLISLKIGITTAVRYFHYNHHHHPHHHHHHQHFHNYHHHRHHHHCHHHHHHHLGFSFTANFVGWPDPRTTFLIIIEHHLFQKSNIDILILNIILLRYWEIDTEYHIFRYWILKIDIDIKCHLFQIMNININIKYHLFQITNIDI